MSIPVYKEHILQAITGEGLVEIFNKNLGESPIVIHITHMRDKQIEAIRFIEKYVIEKQIPYKFPYPIYIISAVEKPDSLFKIFKTRNDLPEYYGKKDKKPNIRESQIINKNKLYQNKIRSHFDNSVIDYLNEEAVKQKFLYNLVKEGVFYETLIYKYDNPRVEEVEDLDEGDLNE